VNFILGINDTNLITLGVLIEFLKELHWVLSALKYKILIAHIDHLGPFKQKHN
jgi:hypothetical protein